MSNGAAWRRVCCNEEGQGRSIWDAASCAGEYWLFLGEGTTEDPLK